MRHKKTHVLHGLDVDYISDFRFDLSNKMKQGSKPWRLKKSILVVMRLRSLMDRVAAGHAI